MRIAIVGAGALGSMYALKLSHVAQVTLVVRELSRAPARIFAERVGGAGPTSDARDAPPASTRAPDDADAVLVAVRADQLDDALLGVLAHGGPPRRIVVTLTPLLPASLARARAALGERLVVGMPGVVAYEPDGEPGLVDRHVRYWTPRVSPTALDARDAADPRAQTIRDLAETLVAAGLPAEVHPDVARTNSATTIAFFPLLLAISAAGASIDALLDDGALLRLALDAAKETRAMAKTVGDLAGFSRLLLSFAGTFTVRAGVKLVRARSPEALTFLEHHFGTKLVGQNDALLAEIVALGRERGAELDALEQLARRAGLTARRGGG